MSEKFEVSVSLIKDRLYSVGVKTGRHQKYDDICSVADCDNEEEALGFCHSHYCRLIRTGDVGEDIPLNHYAVKGCSVDDCESSHFGLGFCKKHYRNTPASVAATHRRRLLESDSVVDEIDRICLFTMWNWTCFFCKNELPEKDRDKTIEHLVPLSRGGSHCWENVVPACRGCNSSKSNKTFTEFVYWNGGFTFYD